MGYISYIIVSRVQEKNTRGSPKASLDVYLNSRQLFGELAKRGRINKFRVCVSR